MPNYELTTESYILRVSGFDTLLEANQSSRSGATITQPGTYEVTLDYNVTSISTGIQLRANTEGGVGIGRRVTVPADGGGTFRYYANVTAAMLAKGTVNAVVEVAAVSGSETITWTNATVTVRRIGGPQ